MRNTAIILTMACFLASAASADEMATAEPRVPEMTDEELTDVLRAYLAIDLYDAEAARFARWEMFDLSNGERATCFLINSTNQLGGYTGFKPMVIYSNSERSQLVWPTTAGEECEQMRSGLSNRPATLNQ